jgi:hypothetical protein
MVDFGLAQIIGGESEPEESASLKEEDYFDQDYFDDTDGDQDILSFNEELEKEETQKEPEKEKTRGTGKRGGKGNPKGTGKKGNKKKTDTRGGVGDKMQKISSTYYKKRFDDDDSSPNFNSSTFDDQSDENQGYDNPEVETSQQQEDSDDPIKATFQENDDELEDQGYDNPKVETSTTSLPPTRTTQTSQTSPPTRTSQISPPTQSIQRPLSKETFQLSLCNVYKCKSPEKCFTHRDLDAYIASRGIPIDKSMKKRAKCTKVDELINGKTENPNERQTYLFRGRQCSPYRTPEIDEATGQPAYKGSPWTRESLKQMFDAEVAKTMANSTSNDFTSVFKAKQKARQQVIQQLGGFSPKLSKVVGCPLLEQSEQNRVKQTNNVQFQALNLER